MASALKALIAPRAHVGRAILYAKYRELLQDRIARAGSSPGASQRSAMGKPQIRALRVLSALDTETNSRIAERKRDEALPVRTARERARPSHRVAGAEGAGTVCVGQAFDALVSGRVTDRLQQLGTIQVLPAAHTLFGRAVAVGRAR